MEKGIAVAILFLVAGVILGGAVGFISGMVLFGSDVVQSFSADLDKYREHFDVTVSDYELRNGKIYVKFRNDGKRPVDDMYFEIEVRDSGGRLIGEYTENYMVCVKPGAEEETLLEIHDDEGNAVEIKGNITVKYSYGWSTKRRTGS